MLNICHIILFQNKKNDELLITIQSQSHRHAPIVYRNWKHESAACTITLQPLPHPPNNLQI